MTKLVVNIDVINLEIVPYLMYSYMFKSVNSSHGELDTYQNLDYELEYGEIMACDKLVTLWIGLSKI